MKKFIPLLLAVFAVTLASCEKDPDMDKLDNNYLVYTNYDKKADFKTFETYYLPDSILVIGDKENAEYCKAWWVLLQSYPVCLANGRARLLLWLF